MHTASIERDRSVVTTMKQHGFVQWERLDGKQNKQSHKQQFVESVQAGIISR